jgi:hypothetical protein
MKNGTCDKHEKKHVMKIKNGTCDELEKKYVMNMTKSLTN